MNIYLEREREEIIKKKHTRKRAGRFIVHRDGRVDIVRVVEGDDAVDLIGQKDPAGQTASNPN